MRGKKREGEKEEEEGKRRERCAKARQTFAYDGYMRFRFSFTSFPFLPFSSFLRKLRAASRATFDAVARHRRRRRRRLGAFRS